MEKEKEKLYIENLKHIVPTQEELEIMAEACSFCAYTYNIKKEELIGEGYIGLLEALKTHDTSKGNIKTWIKIKVKFRIIDSYRKLTHHRTLKRTDKWILSLDKQLPDNEKTTLGDTCEDHINYQKQSDSKIDSDYFMTILSDVIGAANTKIFYMYYADGLNMQEIAENLGLTEGRISQKLKEIKERVESIKTKLEKYYV